MNLINRIKSRQRSKFILTLLLWGGSMPLFGQLYAIGNGSTLSNGGTPAGKYPHPYLAGGLQLQGRGYAPAAWAGEMGVNAESEHLALDSSVSYSTARKVNDNTVNNFSGHQRGLDGNVFYRFSKLYAGGGASWSQLSTTNYTKQSWHPAVGLGHDWLRQGFSMRSQVLCLMPGDDHLNGTQGLSSCCGFRHPWPPTIFSGDKQLVSMGFMRRSLTDRTKFSQQRRTAADQSPATSRLT